MTDNSPASADFMLLVDWQNEISDTVINGLPGRPSAPRPSEADAAEIEKMLLAGTLGPDHKFYASKREPRGLIRSAISNVWHQIQYDRSLAATPPADTSAKKELRQAAKAAFGAEPTLVARAALRRILIEQGADPKSADARLVEIAKAFGATLSTLAAGKTTPREFMSPKAAARAAAAEDEDDDDGEDDGEPERSAGAPAKKVATAPDGSKNPWSAAAWNVTEQGRLARVFGVEKAQTMASGVGCHLGSTQPNPKFSK